MSLVCLFLNVMHAERIPQASAVIKKYLSSPGVVLISFEKMSRIFVGYMERVYFDEEFLFFV